MELYPTICIWIVGICIPTHLQCILGQSVISVGNRSDSNSSMANIGTNSTNQTSINQTDHQHHYIVRLYFSLKEDSIMPYIRDEIYYNSYLYNISSEDLIELSNLRVLTLDESLERLRTLNISQNVLNVTSFKTLLDFVSMTFTEFYEKLKTGANLTGPPLLEALQSLNIDSSNFSHAVTYGQQENVYDVLSKGIYTRENFQIAASKLGTDLESFFRIMKNIIVEQMATNSLSYYEEKITVMFPWADKKFYDDVWSAFGISMLDVYLVPNVRKIVDVLSTVLQKNMTLGLATSSHEITIHKKIYKRLENVLRLVSINAAEVVNYQNSYDGLTFTPGRGGNFATLWSNSSIVSTIDISKKMMSNNDQNCIYITINDTQVIENQAKILNNSQNSIVVETETGTLFNVGNPLICRGELVGLAAMHCRENNSITFDTFYHPYEKVSNSSFHNRNMLPLLFSHLLFLFILRIVH